MVVLFDGKQSFNAYSLSEDLKIKKEDIVEESYRAEYFDRLIQQIQHCSDKTIDDVATALAEYIINIDPYEFYDEFGSFGSTAEDFFEIRSQMKKLLQDEQEKKELINSIQANKELMCNDSLNEEIDVVEDEDYFDEADSDDDYFYWEEEELPNWKTDWKDLEFEKEQNEDKENKKLKAIWFDKEEKEELSDIDTNPFGRNKEE